MAGIFTGDWSCRHLLPSTYQSFSLPEGKQVFSTSHIISQIFWAQHAILMGFPGGAIGKESACQCRRHKKCRSDLWIKKIPWKRAWQPTPVFAPGEFHEQRSLVDYSLYGHKQLDTTEATAHTHTHTRARARVHHSYGEKNPLEICLQTPDWDQIFKQAFLRVAASVLLFQLFSSCHCSLDSWSAQWRCSVFIPSK